MYNTTAEYKTEIKNPSRSFECKITIGDKIFINEDIVDIKLNGNIQPSDGFKIGATTSQTLDLTLLNKGDTIYSTNQIKLEIGLKIGNTIEYIPMGIYNVDDIEKTDYTIKITAFDNMIKFETGYFSELGDAPSLTDVANELATKTGVQFIGSLPAYTVSNLEGFTCREILGYVASICGGNALITRDGKFTIVYPKDVNYSINADNYFTYKNEEVKYKVGQVTCKVKDETISKGSLGTDSMELTFENPWVTDSILTDIYNKLKGFEFLGYTMKWQGDLSLDPGDIITCTDRKGVVRKLPILSQKLTYTGGLVSEISAKGESKNKNSFNANGSNSNKLDRVVTDLAIVNKAFVDYAHINDADITNLKAETAKIQNLEVETADINTILANFISGDHGQFLHLTVENVIFDEAVIKDLIAQRITVADLLAGNIDTNRFNIVSTDGGISIVGATQQFKDKNNVVRLQIGQDAQGNFNFILKGLDGTTTLIDHTGVKEDAIADDLIKENMVAENAIGEKQINYSSLITGLNKDNNTETIKASKVALDTTGQTLNVAFTEMEATIDDIKVGGRNLIRDSKEYTFAKSTGDYNYWNTQVSLKNSTEYTFSVGKSELLEGVDTKFSVRVYDLITKVSVSKEILISDERQYVTMLVPETGNFTLLIYSGTAGSTANKVLKLYEVKLEEGNKATDWTPATEDIDSKMETLNTELNVQQGQIDTLIENTTITKDGVTTQLKDEYNKTVDTVNSHTATIGSHTTKIGDLEKTTSSHTTSIAQNTTDISLKASKTEVSEAVGNIKVGGENLFNFTDYSKVAVADLFDRTNKSAWYKNVELNAGISTYSAPNNKEQDKFIKGKKVLALSYPVTSTSLKQCIVNPYGEGGTDYIELKPNTEYTLSGYMYTGGGATDKLYWVIWGYDDAGANRTVLKQLPDHGPWTGAFEWFEFKFTTDSRKFYQTRLYINAKASATTGNAACNIYNLKLEEGNKATAWSPSTKDSSGEMDTKINSAKSEIKVTTDAITQRVGAIEGSYVTQTQLNQSSTNITAAFTSSGGANMLKNSNFKNDIDGWKVWGTNDAYAKYNTPDGKPAIRVYTTSAAATSIGWSTTEKELNFIVGRKYSLSFNMRSYSGINLSYMTNNFIINDAGNKFISELDGYSFKYESISGGYYRIKITFTADKTYTNSRLLIGARGMQDVVANTTGFGIYEIMLQESAEPTPWQPHPTEVYNTRVTIDEKGIKCNLVTGEYAQMGADGFKWHKSGNARDYHALAYVGSFAVSYAQAGKSIWINLPSEFKNKNFNVICALKGYDLGYGNSRFIVDRYSVTHGTLDSANARFEFVGDCRVYNKDSPTDIQYTNFNVAYIAIA